MFRSFAREAVESAKPQHSVVVTDRIKHPRLKLAEALREDYTISEAALS